MKKIILLLKGVLILVFVITLMAYLSGLYDIFLKSGFIDSETAYALTLGSFLLLPIVFLVTLAIFGVYYFVSKKTKNTIGNIYIYIVFVPIFLFVVNTIVFYFFQTNDFKL